MKIIILIMLSVLGINAALAAIFFGELAGYVISVLVLILSLFLLRRWFRVTEEQDNSLGFPVGEAIEVSNPDKPVFVKNAQLSALNMNLGTLAIGSQGSGKTESVLLGLSGAQKDFMPGTGHAIFDGKGDIDIYKKYTVRNEVPDYFFSTELPGSQTINLFIGESHDVIERLVYILIGTTASTSFYSDNQRDVLMRVVPLLKSLSEPTNLRDLYVVLSQASASIELVRIAKAQTVDPTIIGMFEQWLDSEDHNKRLNEIKGMLNRLYIFVNSPFASRLNTYQPDINVESLIDQNQRAYFHMPYTEFSVDVATAISEMFAVAAKTRQLGGPDELSAFPLYFDDWGKFFYSGFSPFQARCRSAKMPLLFSFQSYAQLEEVSQTFAEQLDDMTATKIILRCLGEKTGNYAVRLIGEYDRLELSESELGSRSGTNLQSRSTYRLKPRDLRALQAGEAYISTLIQRNGKTESPLWKTRLPLPDFTGWQAITLPKSRMHEEGRGLNFWSKYYNPEFNQQVVSRALKKAKSYKEVIL